LPSNCVWKIILNRQKKSALAEKREGGGEKGRFNLLQSTFPGRGEKEKQDSSIHMASPTSKRKRKEGPFLSNYQHIINKKGGEEKNDAPPPLLPLRGTSWKGKRQRRRGGGKGKKRGRHNLDYIPPHSLVRRG